VCCQHGEIAVCSGRGEGAGDAAEAGRRRRPAGGVAGAQPGPKDQEGGRGDQGAPSEAAAARDQAAGGAAGRAEVAVAAPACRERRPGWGLTAERGIAPRFCCGSVPATSPVLDT
jgi:hypothetical protein